MMWMTISEFQDKHFTHDSRPSRNTVTAWIKSGALVGKKIGGQWYVDPDAERPAKDVWQRRYGDERR